MISDLPSYVKYWRNKFSQRLDEIGANDPEMHDNKPLTREILVEYTTCLQMDTEKNNSLPNVENDGILEVSKSNFYFLSDVLPEDKVISLMVT